MHVFPLNYKTENFKPCFFHHESHIALKNGNYGKHGNYVLGRAKREDEHCN